MRVFLIVMVILLVLLLIFAVQNPGSTDVTFITFSTTAPLLLIILVSAMVGLLLGVAIMAPGSLRRATRLRRLDSEIRALEERSAEVQAATTERAMLDEPVAHPSSRSTPGPSAEETPKDRGGETGGD